MSQHDFTDKEISQHLDTFFKNKQVTETRIVIAVEEGFKDPMFREDIANGMEDVKILLEQFDEYMKLKSRGNKLVMILRD